MKSICWICHILCICSIVFVIKAFKLSYICQHCSIWNTDSFFCAFPSIHFFNINKKHHTLLLHAWSFIMNIDQAFHSISAKKMSSMLKNPQRPCICQSRVPAAISTLIGILSASDFPFYSSVFCKGFLIYVRKVCFEENFFQNPCEYLCGFWVWKCFLFWRRTSVFTL